MNGIFALIVEKSCNRTCIIEKHFVLLQYKTKTSKTMAEIKINYTISIEGNIYLLCPVNNGEYEVYTRTNDDTFSGYIGNFVSTNKLETLEFEREFTAWLKGEKYIADNNVEDVLAELMNNKCTALYDDKGTKCYRSSKCHRDCPYFINAVNQLKK